MTTYNKATLKTFFETNDVPDGTDYGNLIDSCLNLVDTTEQSMAGALKTTELVASRVSAGNGNFTGTLTLVGAFNVNSLTVANAVSANAGYFGSDVSVSGNIFIGGNVSAKKGYFNTDLSVSGNTTTGALTITGQTSANNLNLAGEFIRAPITYSAAGTAQATATPVSAGISVLIGASDGQATGYILMANKTGLTQQIYNQNTVSANLWPCIGGQINVLSSNAAFGMAASTLYTVVHTRASGYAVK